MKKPEYFPHKIKAATPTRRSVLKRGLSMAGALGVPHFIPSSALGRDGHTPPSERVILANIGSGGMGGIDAGNFLGIPECQIVAICDVDTSHFEPLKGNIERWYANRAETENYNGVDTYQDFREVLARDDIDAVFVVTPDHWHARIGIAALEAGKDLYGEKPMTLTIADGRRLVNAVERTGGVFQLGTQTRSDPGVRRTVELVRNGRIGEIKRVQIGIPGGLFQPDEPPQPVPESLDWEAYLGPAPFSHYHPARVHNYFRCVMDFSDGPITDLGIHYIDVAQWGCKHELTGPIELEGWGDFPETGLYDAALQCGFKATFADGIIYDVSTKYPTGPRFEGTEGWINIPMRHPLPTDEPITASDPRILESRLGPGEERLYQSDNHWGNFVECTRTRGETAAPAEGGHRSTTVAHLGTIATKLQRKLRWDPETETFPDDPDANAWVDRAEHDRIHDLV
jgi:predicted dehydrogenase